MMTDSSPPAIRGHHLFCMQYSHGKGYSAEFAANMLRVVAKLEEIGGFVSLGRDDICSSCPRPIGDASCSVTKAGEAGINDLDAIALELLGMRVGDLIVPGTIKDRVGLAARKWQKIACVSCESRDICAPMIELAAITV